MIYVISVLQSVFQLFAQLSELVIVVEPEESDEQQSERVSS